MTNAFVSDPPGPAPKSATDWLVSSEELTTHARRVLREITLDVPKNVYIRGFVFGLAIDVVETPILSPRHCVTDGQSPAAGISSCRICERIVVPSAGIAIV